MGHNISESSVRVRGSPRRRSPSRRERSPAHHRSSQKARSPPQEKPTSRKKSPRRRSPEESPSPRAKRLRKVQAQAQRESEKVAEREYGRDHYREDERSVHRERHADRQVPNDKERGRNHNREDGRVAHGERVTDRQVRDEERKGRRSGRDVDSGVSRLRHERSFSPPDRHLKSRHRSLSPYQDADKNEVTGSRGAEHRNNDTDSVAKMKAAEEALTTNEKQKPSFELSGKLAAETNRVRGVTLLFNEPPDAKKPEIRWRLYVFKGGEMLNDPLYVHRQSCYLFGRERRVADIPTDHPSCSKQHAVLQYRQVEKGQPDGTMLKQVSPYLMDLGSTNGTFINDVRIEPQRYYELFEKDTIKFGNSSREYVLLHENSA